MKKIIFVRHGESTENKASTDNKSYDPNNIKLTDEGKKQAMITGKYLYKIFGKFDKVYSSPATRCKETANMIMDEINYKKKLDINELLIEVGYNHHNLDGLSKDEQNKIFDSIKIDPPKDKSNLKLFNGIKTYRQLEKRLEETVNPYDRTKLYNIGVEIENKQLEMKPNASQVKNNIKKFLNNLKKTDDNETILIISHVGCIILLQKLICNIDNMDIVISTNLDTNKLFSNCCICCLGLENNKLTLVSPANTNHLK